MALWRYVMFSLGVKSVLEPESDLCARRVCVSQSDHVPPLQRLVVLRHQDFDLGALRYSHKTFCKIWSPNDTLQKLLGAVWRLS